MAQTETLLPSAAVVAKQYVPGKSAQAPVAPAQPGVQRSPREVGMQAFAKPNVLLPAPPMPAQSDERTQPLVHQRPLQVSPVSQGLNWGPHGSPTPDSAQIGQSRARQDDTSWREKTPVGN